MPVDPSAPPPGPQAPAVRVDTPSKTSKVNGATSSSVGSKTYDIKPYDPSKYAITTTTTTGQNGAKPSGTVDATPPGSYLHPHDSPSLPMRPRQPGEAASYYSGTPQFPPPPGSAVNSNAPGGASVGGGSVVSMVGPAGLLSASPTLHRERGLRACKIEAESAMREYLELQQRVRMGAGSEEKDRLRRLAGRVVNEIRDLRREVGVLVRRKEGGRIGRFIVGGVIAGFIPLIRHFFRRPSSLRSTMSKTEYAYSRSMSMVRRILASLKSALFSIPATVAMFVLAALYVFQAEVVLRVGRTISKRLKKLQNRLQAGESGGMGGSGVMIEEGDLELLQGWRWRVLLWTG